MITLHSYISASIHNLESTNSNIITHFRELNLSNTINYNTNSLLLKSTVNDIACPIISIPVAYQFFASLIQKAIKLKNAYGNSATGNSATHSLIVKDLLQQKQDYYCINLTLPQTVPRRTTFSEFIYKFYNEVDEKMLRGYQINLARDAQGYNFRLKVYPGFISDIDNTPFIVMGYYPEQVMDIIAESAMEFPIDRNGYMQMPTAVINGMIEKAQDKFNHQMNVFVNYEVLDSSNPFHKHYRKGFKVLKSNVDSNLRIQMRTGEELKSMFLTKLVSPSYEYLIMNREKQKIELKEIYLDFLQENYVKFFSTPSIVTDNTSNSANYNINADGEAVMQ